MARATSSPRVVTTIADLHAARPKLSGPVGLVPTMGALHAGHAALFRRARAECGGVIASIFVNPLQFGPGEDLARYPRTLDADVELLEHHGVDLVFAPDDSQMYPRKLETTVDPGAIATRLEGDRRVGHFRGVATVVLKLFNLTRPDRAYFGRKDAQQLAVITRITADLDLGIEIVGCETEREAGGLACSSRNAYLSVAERAAAPNLYRALRHIADNITDRTSRNTATNVADRATRGPTLPDVISNAEKLLPPLKLDYLAVVNPDEFEPLADLPALGPLLAVGAAFAGTTRLIDNVVIRNG